MGEVCRARDTEQRPTAIHGCRYWKGKLMKVYAKGSMVFAAVIVASISMVSAQVDVQPGQKYLLLATTRTSTMQEELDQAAALGFRIVTGSPTSNEIILLLERADDPIEPRVYRLLATSRVGTFEQELNNVAAEGFRLLPKTLMLTSGGGFGFARGAELVGIAERMPDEASHVEYRILATARTSTLQEEVSAALEEGWTLVSLSGGREDFENLAILERVVP